MTAPSKWRVFKTRGMWIVRNPRGDHFGAYLTWGEAIAQVTSRRVISTAGVGGYFDRRGAWEYDRAPAFGFQREPTRCVTGGEQ